jgi:hypothetical protein
MYSVHIDILKRTADMSPRKASRPSTLEVLAPSEASPELRRLVERLVADAAIPPNASLSRIRSILAGAGLVISEGEILYPQDRTSFVIELDQILERRAQGGKAARRAAAKAGGAAAAKAEDGSMEIDDSVSAASGALYGASDEPERSNDSEESVEDPLRDWPEDASGADPWQDDGPGQKRSGRDA